MVEQRTAAQLLGAENSGTEIIVRDSDGAVFIRQQVAERVIDRLRAKLAGLQRPAGAELVEVAARAIAAVRSPHCEAAHGSCGRPTDEDADCDCLGEARAVLAAVAGRIRAQTLDAPIEAERAAWNEAIIAGKTPLERWERHTGISTYVDLKSWAEMQLREVLTLRAKREPDGPRDDDLSNYLVGKQAALSQVLANMRQIEERAAAPQIGAPDFQSRVQPWMLACFGAEISADRVERDHRFLEEALELVQANGCTQAEAHQLVDYVYGRPQGDINQEVGGVMVTLAALCLANGEDMHAAGEKELARVWTKIEQIRAKQAAKPKHSPLPGPTIRAGADDGE